MGLWGFWDDFFGEFCLTKNIHDRATLKQSYPSWVEEGLIKWGLERDARWTESVAVGSKEFVEKTTKALAARLRGRKVRGSSKQTDPINFVLCESMNAYKRGFGAQSCIIRRK